MAEALLYLASDDVPRYALVAESAVAAALTAGAVRAFEYASSGLGYEDVTLQTIPRAEIARWAAALGATPSEMLGLTDAQLILIYLRKLGRTTLSRVQVVELDDVDGDAAGGTAVEITGVGFSVGRAASTAVTFGGTAATSVVVVSDTVITCVTPAHAAGAVAVVVTNSNGSHSLADAFTYA